jgi:hypothetical protein
VARYSSWKDEHRLPETSAELRSPDTRPYFLWWTTHTVGEFKELLSDSDPERRAYWLGALLREANTRDVWLFTTPEQIRSLWPFLVRHLGRSRERWAWLLDVEDTSWPPVQEERA